MTYHGFLERYGFGDSMNPLYDYDFNLMRSRNLNLLCGVDEVGRGPLAGPVMACAFMPAYQNEIQGVNDSKKIPPAKRSLIYSQLMETVICYKTITVSPQEIDETNILKATIKAMQLAIGYMFPLPELVLVDAVNLKVPFVSCESIIKGDLKCYSIACASIIAKVERDMIMENYAHIYPEYGFEKNKGYGTKHHIEMIKKYGPCEIHRQSFIKNFV